MEKKDLFFDKYRLVKNDDGTVEVEGETAVQYLAVDDSVDILRKIAKLKGREAPAAFKDHQERRDFAHRLINEFGDPFYVENYRIKWVHSTDWPDYPVFYVYIPVPNKIEVLRGIAERISFKYDLAWDANTLGNKLIDFMK